MADQFAILELTDGHLRAVVDLCRAALDLPEDAVEADEIVACLLDRPPPAHRPVAVVAEAGGVVRGVAIGSISEREAALAHVDLVAVHPGSRRGGMGRALVSRLETALAGLGAAEVALAGNPPHYAWPGIDVRYTPAICAATALGYAQEQIAWNMTADLSYPAALALRPTELAERRLAERGITVRRAGPDDVPALADFAQGRFGGSWGGEVRRSVGRPGTGCHLAVDADGEVLGFAAYGSARTSWFGPMGTAPAAQGLGIGAVLLRRCLRDQGADGHRRAEIGWVGPVRFYADSAGARIERVFVLYRKRLESGRTGAEPQ